MGIILSGSSLSLWFIFASLAFRTLCVLPSPVVGRCHLGFSVHHLFGGRPRGLGFGKSRLYARATWPNHLTLLVLIVSVIVVFICKAVLIVSVLTRSRSLTPEMARRHRISNASNFLLSSDLMVHVSAAYVAIGGWVLYIVSLSEACLFRVFARLGSSVYQMQLRLAISVVVGIGDYASVEHKLSDVLDFATV